jgi:carboxymethylenebutenolidase
MKTANIKVKLRDGEMGAYLAVPDRTPAGGIIAIMEIWGVNETMRRHAHEFAQAGFVCLVPDLFWRQEPGVELSDGNPEHVRKAFDLYYDFDYDLAVRDMEDTWHYVAGLKECNGRVGAVGYCLGGKLCYLMCCRTDIDCAVAYYGTYIEHHIREVKNLHRPFLLHMAMKDRWVQAEVNELLERRLSPNPLVQIHKYPNADHAFARYGGKTYSKPEADPRAEAEPRIFPTAPAGACDGAGVTAHVGAPRRYGVETLSLAHRFRVCRVRAVRGPCVTYANCHAVRARGAGRIDSHPRASPALWRRSVLPRGAWQPSVRHR